MFTLKNNRRHGSTIIEVLIATTLVGFALTGLAMLMTTNVKNSAEADYREAAAGIAQDTMEKIRQRKTTVAWSVFKSDPYNSASTPECNAISAPNVITKYNTNFYVTCTNPAAGTDEIAITVEVCWPTVCSSATTTTKAVQRFYNN